ncbi:uncharacterized protein [Panulirus ornatus]|uniref:uncharacterized protein n=1 Tax=Panulirus ornatus TaxID=150431 RepID=UPI003A85D5F1
MDPKTTTWFCGDISIATFYSDNTYTFYSDSSTSTSYNATFFDETNINISTLCSKTSASKCYKSNNSFNNNATFYKDTGTNTPTTNDVVSFFKSYNDTYTSRFYSSRDPSTVHADIGTSLEYNISHIPIQYVDDSHISHRYVTCIRPSKTSFQTPNVTSASTPADTIYTLHTSTSARPGKDDDDDDATAYAKTYTYEATSDQCAVISTPSYPCNTSSTNTAVFYNGGAEAFSAYSRGAVGVDARTPTFVTAAFNAATEP